MSTMDSSIGTTRLICSDVTMAQVKRFAIFLIFIAAAASLMFGQTPRDGLADTVFSEIPFDRWISEGDRGHMHWTAQLSQPQLSVHQRMVARAFVEVDGAELARRRGKGRFLVLVQLNDEKSRIWQRH